MMLSRKSTQYWNEYNQTVESVKKLARKQKVHDSKLQGSDTLQDENACIETEETNNMESRFSRNNNGIQSVN